MTKKTKLILMIGGILVGAGLCLAVLGFGLGGRYSFSISSKGFTLYDQPALQQTQDVSLSAFTELDIRTRDLDIQWVASDHYGAVYTFVQQDDQLDIRQEGDRVTIRSPRAEFALTFFWFKPNNTLTLYYPAGTPLASLTLIHSNGSADLTGLESGTLDLTVSNGPLQLRDVEGNVAKLEVSNGPLTVAQSRLTDVSIRSSNGGVDLRELASGSVNLTQSNASLTLSRCTAERMNLRKTNGDTTGDGLAVTQGLQAHFTNGRMNLKGDLAGALDFSGSNGDLTLALSQAREAYDLQLQARNGNLTVDGTRIDGTVQDAKGRANSLTAKRSNGSMVVDFEK